MILTARDPAMKGEEARKAGAVLYVKKPVKIATLLRVVLELFGISDSEALKLLTRSDERRRDQSSASPRPGPKGSRPESLD